MAATLQHPDYMLTTSEIPKTLTTAHAILFFKREDRKGCKSYRGIKTEYNSTTIG